MSTLKVINAIGEIENSSKRVIPEECYYILHIKLLSATISEHDKLLKNILTRPNVDHQACIVYISPFKDEVWLLFSCVQKPNFHNFKGCHQELCSYFASWMTVETGSLTKCWLTELNTRTKVIEYFHSVVFLNMFKRAGNTFATIDDAIEAFPKEKWNELPPFEKFGIFYKYANFESMCEEIDYKTFEKYKTFFFE